jgi:hypothetical protein
MRAQYLPSFAASHRLIIAAVAHQIKKEHRVCVWLQKKTALKNCFLLINQSQFYFASSAFYAL